MENSKYIKTVHFDSKSIRVEHGECIAPYLKETFYVEYELDDDLSCLDSSIAVIPFILSTVAIVWCRGLKLYIENLDKTFARCLPKLKDEYKKMYKTIKWDGEIIVENEIENNSEGNYIGLLFSGGLDSIHAAIMDSKDKILFSVWGADTNPDVESEWMRIKYQTKQFKSFFNHKDVYIRSNFRTFLNDSVLHTMYKEISHWYTHVQHGPALIGLTTPVMALLGKENLFISSTHAVGELTRGWGSTKILDESINFSNIKVKHVGGDCTRQEKTKEIVAFRRKNLDKNFTLKVCPKHTIDGENCGICEKCLRTSVGLILECEDPQNWGFKQNAFETIDILKKNMLSYKIKMTENEVLPWKDIQKRIKSTNIDSALLQRIKWLLDVNLDLHAKKYEFYSGRWFYKNSPRFLRKIGRRIFFIFKNN